MAVLSEPQMSTPPKDVKPDAGFDAVHDEKVIEQNGVDNHREDYSGAATKTDPAEIALVRKLDRMIMVRLGSNDYRYLHAELLMSKPILWAMYFLNYLDRNALPQARLNSLEKDLNLKGVQYNTAISILFVGYLLMQSMLCDHIIMTLGANSGTSQFPQTCS